MSYDKYKNWPMPGTGITMAYPIGHPGHSNSLEEQVLEDLEEVKDKTEALEILDSYAAYQQRLYQQELASIATLSASDLIAGLLKPLLLTRLPEVYAMHRGRTVKTPEPKP